MTQSVIDLNELTEPRLRALDPGVILDHPSQLDFLTASQSLDVQAAPGSGKTTLTALKLCAMARGWRSRPQGICVLSHTNVAKDQIAERLDGDRFGRTLLRPPHYIGTIQGFVDTFLGLPYARSRGINVRFIDNETYAAEALRRLSSWRSLFTLRSYLSRRHDGPRLITSATYIFEGDGELSIRPDGRRFPTGPATSTFKQYVALKGSMTEDGYFRFQDMYAFARKVLQEHPEIGAAVATRFPWVIIDEMQDTSAGQQALLEQVFPPGKVVVQRIGDENQRIFADVEGAGFPAPDALELPVSRRFGAGIARAVGSLTMRRPQEIIGNPEADDGERLLILFDETVATQVIHRFAQEAETLLSAVERDTYPLRVVAARTDASQAKRFPRTVRSYVPDYRPDATVATASTAGCLIDSVRRAQKAAASGSQPEATTMLWGALAAVADLCGIRTTRGRLSGSRLRRLVRFDSPSAELDTRRLLRHLMEEAVTDSAKDWQVAVEHVLDWELITSAEAHDQAADYCRYVKASTESLPAAAGGVPPPPIAPRTIHGVKGETHSGTLILECLDKTGNVFDLPEALKLITGRATPGELSASALAACQLAFVGASRPRSLLALAVLGDHAEPYLNDLHELGWQIADMRGVPPWPDV